MSFDENLWAVADRLLKRDGGEEHLAVRIEAELKRRGMTQQALVRALADAGCQLPQSAISKIVNPQRGGRRSITVDEAIAFSKVFDTPLADLLLPEGALREGEPHLLLAEYFELKDEISDLMDRVSEVVTRFGELTAGSAYWDDLLERFPLEGLGERPAGGGLANAYDETVKNLEELQQARKRHHRE